MAKLRKQTDWLATHYPGAAASLREGLEETFTINRLELSSTLRRCLGTTNPDYSAKRLKNESGMC
jgi:putative transposase